MSLTTGMPDIGTKQWVHLATAESRLLVLNAGRRSLAPVRCSFSFVIDHNRCHVEITRIASDGRHAAVRAGVAWQSDGMVTLHS
jgi:hypothetical protein